jgi:polyisoprenoid-binding protein YceI
VITQEHSVQCALLAIDALFCQARRMISPLRRSTIAGLVLLGAYSLDAAADSETYRFDPVHSLIWFRASHEQFSHPLGRLRIKDGWFQVDPKDLKQARVYVEVDLGSVDMGDGKWNDTIKSGQFFDVGQFPTARYTSKSVTASGDSAGVIHGDLYLHGETHPVDIEFKLNHIGNDPYTFKNRAGFSAHAKLERSAFGMKRYADVVGETIELIIEIEGVPDRGAAAATPEAKPNGD